LFVKTKMYTFVIETTTKCVRKMSNSNVIPYLLQRYILALENNKRTYFLVKMYFTFYSFNLFVAPYSLLSKHLLKFDHTLVVLCCLHKNAFRNQTYNVGYIRYRTYFILYYCFLHFFYSVSFIYIFFYLSTQTPCLNGLNFF